MQKNLLLIAKNWPEPNSTAAGRRTADLLSLFSPAEYHIHIACAAERTPFQANYHEQQATLHSIAVNDNQFDSWLTQLKPSIVIYDRYVMEEQFGWRVKNSLPDALTLLDTSDLHCLRLAREAAIKHNTDVNLFNEHAIREITSIVHCDLTIMISQVEVDILKDQFNIDEALLTYLPFLIEPDEIDCSVGFSERKHLMMIGGFKHEPNRDATRWLKSTLWPALKKTLPRDVELHIFGGYADHAMNQLNNPKERFFVKGRVDDALATLKKYRINLAPLRFGAGQKGKILEGWLTGTPTLTTPIGAESMANEHELGYTPTVDPEIFAQQALQLYSDQSHWQQLQKNAVKRLEDHFLKSHYQDQFQTKISHIQKHLAQHRQRNFWGQLLWSNQFRASEYMSRWITLKNQK